jgi:pyruvate formate lyase activating enzyme
MLKEGKVDYEFRNTSVPDIVDEEDISNMGEIVKGAQHFVFQQFVPGDTLDKSFNNVKPYHPDVIARFAEEMRKYVKKVTVRI